MAEMIVTTPGRTRLRRLRRTKTLRNLVAETTVSAEHLIMPHFVVPAKRANEPISSMPGISQMGLENVVKQIGKDLELGIRAVLLFGHPEHGGKTPDGREAAAANGAVQKTCERLKRDFGNDLVVMTDVCLCAYTDHGHCGILNVDGRVLNDESLLPLVNMAVSHARAGADVVAPSDMMDGRIARDSRCARRCSLRGHAADVLRREVRVGLLRPVPRGGGLARPRWATGRATRWTPATAARPCAKRCSTSTRAPTGSW